MTVCKLALANVGMWVRDRYFRGASMLMPGGTACNPSFSWEARVHWGPESVEVELKAFNDRALNRDVGMLCTKVGQGQLRLPDGRRLLLRVHGASLPNLEAQERAVA